jgi:phosphopantetheine--protein transferase-like protein
MQSLFCELQIPNLSMISPKNSSFTNASMIKSVGIDMIYLHRLAQAIERRPTMFQRLCSSEEKPEYTCSQSLGLIWASILWTGKEAIAKCLQTGIWRAGIAWEDLLIGSEEFYTKIQNSNSSKIWQTQAGFKRHAAILTNHTQCSIHFQIYQSSECVSTEELSPVNLNDLHHVIQSPHHLQNLSSSLTLNPYQGLQLNSQSTLIMIAHAVQWGSTVTMVKKNT